MARVPIIEVRGSRNDIVVLVRGERGGGIIIKTDLGGGDLAGKKVRSRLGNNKALLYYTCRAYYNTYIMHCRVLYFIYRVRSIKSTDFFFK